MALAQKTLYQRQQSPIAGAKIEHLLRAARNEFKQRRFSLSPVRNGICATQIIVSVFGTLPEVCGRVRIHTF